MARDTKDRKLPDEAPRDGEPLGLGGGPAELPTLPSDLVASPGVESNNAAAAIAAGEIKPGESAEPRPAKQPDNTARCCPYHKGVPLRANKTEAFFTRYYCPKEGCTYSEKVPRPRIKAQIEEAAGEGFSAR